MKDLLMKAAKWLFSSYDNSSAGASAKKLSAFAFMVLIGYLHFKFCDHGNSVDFLAWDIGGLLALLGVASFEKIKISQGTSGSNQRDIPPDQP